MTDPSHAAATARADFPASDQPTVVLDHAGTVVEVNAAAEAHLGETRDALLGRPITELLGDPDGPQPLVVITPGDLAGEAERLQERNAFLAEAGLVLDRSLDLEETLRRLAALTVPAYAHLAVIDLIDEEGGVRTAVAAALEPEYARALEAVRASHPISADSAHPVAGVVRTGRSALLPAMDAEFLRSIARGSEHYELIRRMHYRSAVVVPLIARGRVLGALSLLRMEGERDYDDDDLVLAEDLARRAAYAVDNARIFEATRRLARTLQASLLPRALPEIPGVRVATRYIAAQEGQEVGGDFYDVFTIGEGRWGIAIGDVCGKGPEAAALTSLARHTIRAVACAGADAGTVLSLLGDAVIRDTPVTEARFLTALVAIATLAADGLRLELAAAGHPAPLHRRADGTVEPIPVAGPLAGVRPEARYRTQAAVLREGETLLLYTDGLTDAQAPARILSEGDLAAILTEARELAGEPLLARLEERAMQGQTPRDDVAILALEVDPQGASRSSRHPDAPEGGPPGAASET